MKLAVITGASSGIGAATARHFARNGYRVVIVARNQEKLDRLSVKIGPRAIVEPVDAGVGQSVLAMAKRVIRDHGVPDVIVNAAGAGTWKWIEETSPFEAVKMMNAPYFAAFNVTHAFMRDMLNRKKGVIIHVGSPVSFLPWPSSTGYAAARWALRGLNEALNADLRGTGVRSCHVVFGKVNSSYFENNPHTLEKMPAIAKTIRDISPEECAEVILKLAKKPRRQYIYPFMLRFYYWTNYLFPGISRWLMWKTGAKHK